MGGNELIEQQSQAKNVGEKTQEDLNDKLVELGKLEKMLFSGDGEIGGESHDSVIDEEYKKGLEAAVPIQTKIALVESLISQFNKNGEIKDIFSKEKESKYLDDEDEQNIDKIGKETQNLIKKYPEYKDEINLFVKTKFDRNEFTVNFYNPTKNTQNLEPIKIFLKESYKNILLNDMSDIETSIQDIKSNKNISNGPTFLNFLLKNDITTSQIGKKLNSILLLKIVKDGFSDNEKSSNYDNTFGYGTLGEFIQMPEEKLTELNRLYQDNSKPKELVGYIDNNLTIEQRDKLFAFSKVKNIYTEIKKTEFPNGNNFSDDILISLGNIKDNKLKERIKKVMVDYTSKTPNEQQILGFFDKDGEFDDLILSSGIKDKFFALEIFEMLIQNSDGNILCTGFHASLQIKIFIKFQELKALEEKYINKEILELEKRYENNPEMLYKIGKARENANGKPEQLLGILDKYDGSNNHSQAISSIEKPEGKSQPNISESKKTQLQNKYEKLGLKVQISDNGNILGEKGEKDFQQKTSNGKIAVGANEKLIYTSSLGYKFEFANNEIGIDETLEVTQKFDYLNKIGLGYFGENFKKMLELIPIFLPNQGLNLSINEKSGDFLSNYELFNIIIPIFQNIGFIEKGQNLDPLLPQEITDLKMMTRVGKLENGNAFIDGKFDAKLFGKLLQSKNKV